MNMRISNPPLFTQLQEYAIPLYTPCPSWKYGSLLFLLYFLNTVNWIPSTSYSSSSSWGGRAHFLSWSFGIHWPSGTAFALSNLLISSPETFFPLHSKALHRNSICTKLHYNGLCYKTAVGLAFYTYAVSVSCAKKQTNATIEQTM